MYKALDSWHNGDSTCAFRSQEDED